MISMKKDLFHLFGVLGFWGFGFIDASKRLVSQFSFILTAYKLIGSGMGSNAF